MNSSHNSAPLCEADMLLEERLQQPSPVAVAALIFILIILIITFPFTVVLNALVMIAVKVKPRLRSHKSNILLALLASTDFTVGAIIQPTFIAMLVMFLLEEPTGYCVLRVFRIVMGILIATSLLHLALISGERYLAIKHPFTHTTLVTEARLLAASALAWILSVILRIPMAVNKAVFLATSPFFHGATIAFIFFSHVAVYREIRRHEQQIAAQQVTQEARKQFLRDKKALKLTNIIIAALILCYVPLAVSAVVFSRYSDKLSLETTYILILSVWSFFVLNSLFNPIIYSVSMRQFRVAFVELTCRTTVNIAEAEEIEMRGFGAPNTVSRLEAGQKKKEHDQ